MQWFAKPSYESIIGSNPIVSATCFIARVNLMENKVIFTLIEEDKDLPDKTGIEWLDTILEVAQIITARMLIQVQERARFNEQRNTRGSKSDSISTRKRI